MTTTAQMTSGLTRRAVTISGGALALCLFSSGVAFADTGLPPVPSVPGVPTVPSVPGVPSPDNVITTLDQTVKQVTTSNPPSATPPSTTTPGATTPGATKPPTTTNQPAASKTVSKPVAKPATSKVTRAATQQMAALSDWSAPSSFDSMTPTSMALPPATGISASAGTAPAIAPLLMPQTQHVDPAAAIAELDKKSGSPVRAILLTLALAATAAVGYGHLRVVVRS
jgi:hypothetical protein